MAHTRASLETYTFIITEGMDKILQRFVVSLCHVITHRWSNSSGGLAELLLKLGMDEW